MFRLSHNLLRASSILFLAIFVSSALVVAQVETATVSGQVIDSSGLRVAGARIDLVDIDRGTSTTDATDNSGVYRFPSVHPGRYRMQVRATGFRVIDVTGLTVNVQDHLQQNFKLIVGSVSESVTVDGGAPLVDTESGTVSTVVDRNFAENLPMNGRSFQSLIELTPGVALTSSNSYDSGQFSVNGQRADANYWMVDGVSANVGVGVNSGGLPGNGLSGSLGSFSAQGGTNSLVSVDAMQEFRIQTSTYAPEFGRTPGAQISIATRSGTNEVHGTGFDYFRNSALDANDWFADEQGLRKPEERQNDFGGTIGGPIMKDRAFFFLSYEGQRLRLPQVSITNVPDLASRENAQPALKPFLNAFPLPTPNTADDMSAGIGQFDASYSNRSTLDAYSLRIDHTLNSKISLFGRYDYSPSQIVQRGQNGSSSNTISKIRLSIQTATGGSTWRLSPRATVDFRFNYSRANAFGRYSMDQFGGAAPIPSPPFPGLFTSQDGSFLFNIQSLLLGGNLIIGPLNRNLQRQVNLVGSLAVQEGSHSLKFGGDFRRLSPSFEPAAYVQDAIFSDVPSAEQGDLLESNVVGTPATPTFLFRNLGLYAQDTWSVVPRLTVTYGLRWDVDFVPQTLSGPNFAGVSGFKLNDLSTLALAAPGTPPYKTTYRNVAPRIGFAYEVLQSGNKQTVLRGGFGVFYDLASSEAGNSIGVGSYPFGNEFFSSGGTFPLKSANPGPVVPPSAGNPGGLFAFDPKLRLPYTLEYNLALEQTLGQDQSLTASYIGAAGRRLIQTAVVFPLNPAYTFAQLVANTATSDYNAAQLKFQRRLKGGLQGLVSYTWSHSIDTASGGSAYGSVSNLFNSGTQSENRGSSDFDIRNTFSAGITYQLPTFEHNVFARTILSGWSTEDFIVARSAPPLTVTDAQFFLLNGASATIRPDSVPGQSPYLYGAQCAAILEPFNGDGQHFSCPGGKGLNPAAFTNAPVDANGIPLRQGTVGRNALRAFGAVQWDFALHREFPIHETLKLQFRAEMFNVLNHPNFGPLNGAFFTGGYPGFGVATQTLGESLNGSNLGGGGFSALYQIGGPRSIQLALKMFF
jgi:hypothetical protein